jgi:hypothetical protein
VVGAFAALSFPKIKKRIPEKEKWTAVNAWVLNFSPLAVHSSVQKLATP